MFEAIPTPVTRRLGWREWLPALTLVLLWLLIGFGHQPWLPNETDSFAAMLEQAQGGIQAAPTIAGQFFAEHPPLLFWSGAFSIDLFYPLLPEHEAARLVIPFFTLLTLLGVFLAGQFSFAQPRGHIALLALLASLGFMAPSHGLVPAITAAAGTGLILAAFTLYGQHPRRAGVLAGVGAVIGFLGHGLMTPAALALTLLLLPLLPSATQAGFGTFSRTTLLTAIPLLSIWPLWLYQHEPDYLHLWLQQEQLRLSFSKPLTEQLETLSWFTWPTLPLVLLGGWRLRHRLQQLRSLYPAAILAACWLFFSFSSLRELDKLPLLVPLALLATATTEHLRRGAANGFYWFGMMTILFFATLFWFYWGVLILGWPTSLAAHLAKLAPGHLPGWSWHVLLALLLTLGWAMMSRWRQKQGSRCILWIWASGTTLIWGMLLLLLSSWLDYSRSLYPLAQQVRAVLPAQQACLNLTDLNPSNRVMFNYYLHLPQQTCSYSLIEHKKLNTPAAPRGQIIWHGKLRASRGESFDLLYQPVE